MNVKAVTLLAIGQAVAFSQQAEGLQLTLPAQPEDLHACAYRIGTGGDQMQLQWSAVSPERAQGSACVRRYRG